MKNELELDAVAAMASMRCHTASTPSMRLFVSESRPCRDSVVPTGMPQRASLNVIYDTFLNGHLSRGFADEVLALKDSVIKGAMNLHGEVMQKFRKTAANFHYEFNIRSVTQR